MKPGRQRKPADWEAVRKRLAEVRAATEAALALSPDGAWALLDERAKVLARPPPETPAAGEILNVVTFRLASERYAIETRYVREVVRLEDFTPIPGAPEFVLGVTNLRGDVLAIIDLRRFLGAGAQGLTDLARIIVLGDDQPEFGLLADQAEALASLPSDEVLEPPESVAGIGRRHLRGVTKEALIVLDGAALLSDPRLTIDQSEPGVE